MAINGNIDLTTRGMNSAVENPDGSVSTVRTISFQDRDGKETLIPTVIQSRTTKSWKVVPDRVAIKNYLKTGQHFGKFDSVDEADAFAGKLHKLEEEKVKLASTLSNLKKRVPVQDFAAPDLFEDNPQFNKAYLTLKAKLADGTNKNNVVRVNDVVDDHETLMADNGEPAVEIKGSPELDAEIAQLESKLRNR